MSALTEPAFQSPPPPPTPPAEPKAPRATHLWPIAIGVFVLGLIVLVGWFTNLIPRGWTTAGALCFMGLLIFALSFIRLPLVPQKEEPLSLLQKVMGVFYEPVACSAISVNTRAGSEYSSSSVCSPQSTRLPLCNGSRRNGSPSIAMKRWLRWDRSRRLRHNVKR